MKFRPGEMDDLDRKLLLLLIEDPRMPLRDISKKLRVSRQTVNKRMQALARLGVFRNIGVSVHPSYLDSLSVLMFGKSRTASVERTLDRLGQSDLVYQVEVAGGNFLYVFGCLRNASELSEFVEFVKQAAEMPEPTVGLPSYMVGMNPEWVNGPRQRPQYRMLSPLDMRIIVALRCDVRLPVAEIAKRVGASTKTVRRHLARLLDEGSVGYDVPWDPTAGTDMFTLLHVRLRDGADHVRFGRRWLSKYPLKVVYLMAFGNLPNFLIGILNSDKMSEIRLVLEEVRADEDVLIVTPNLLYQERIYANTWRNKLTSAKGQANKISTRDSASRRR